MVNSLLHITSVFENGQLYSFFRFSSVIYGKYVSMVRTKRGQYRAFPGGQLDFQIFLTTFSRLFAVSNILMFFLGKGRKG